MSGWTVVDANNNKSLPVKGTQGAPYIVPATGSQDPVGKLRVSTPQALIDTDFEYGPQPTKWESISLQNNRPGTYYIPQQPLTITAITGAGTTSVTLTGTFTIAANTPVYIQNALDPNANGWWYTTAGGTNTAVVTTANTVASGNQYNPALSYVYIGYFYSGSGFAVGSNAITNTTTVCTATTTSPHGLTAGSYIYVANTSATTNAPNGAWVVATTPTATTFTFNVAAAPTGTITNSAGNNVVYARPSGYVEPRTFDGGIAFSAGGTVPNQQLIRQTRRYFRYQSGKGIAFSSGTSLKPAMFVSGITASSNTATVTTRFAHGMGVGAIVQVSGCEQGSYNGNWAVASVPTPYTFTYTMVDTPAVTTATGFPLRVIPTTWSGSSNRLGMLDQQNGLFFEYDGQTLYAVWRNSVNQINGTVQVTNGSATVTGTNTLFSSQLKPNDFIVIRGQSYRVLTITSDTQLYIAPEYRGTTISQGGALVSKTTDTRVPQNLWTDPCDGTGPSGYVLDLTKMQMFYIDYSWYGAGFARWGLRTTNGQIVYVYQQTNNNQRFEAYMRSGNMSAHYESSALTLATTLISTLAAATGAGGTISVASTVGFPNSGTLKITGSGTSGVIEYVTYTSKTPSSFVIGARAQTGGQGSAQTFTYSATAPIAVENASALSAAALSHWGCSVIMDGQFNDDKSLVFNYGTTTAVPTSSTTPVVLIAIRIAPSVDNGTTGLLGTKEIINRMQLQLTDLGIVTTGNTYLINLILNGYASGALSGAFLTPIQLTNGISSSLAQIAVNTNNVTVTGGESVAALYCNKDGVTTVDLSQVRDLGNSVLGGGTSNTVPTTQSGFYPDGPDILYVVAQAVSSTSGTILARINWKEAQA